MDDACGRGTARGGSDYEPSANAPGAPYQRGIRYLVVPYLYDNSIEADARFWPQCSHTRQADASLAYTFSPAHTGSDPEPCTASAAQHIAQLKLSSAFAQPPHAGAQYHSSLFIRTAAPQP